MVTMATRIFVMYVGGNEIGSDLISYPFDFQFQDPTKPGDQEEKWVQDLEWNHNWESHI